MIDDVRDTCLPALGSHRRDSAGRHPSTADGRDLITAGLSLVLAVDRTDKARFIPATVIAWNKVPVGCTDEGDRGEL
jgi:hypothetical protein